MQNPYLRLIRFDKPIGTFLVLWPTLWAVFIAGGMPPPLYAVIIFTLGAFLTRSAGCAINDYADAEFDKYVERTKNRPLATGSISKKQALMVCAILSMLAFALAFIGLKPATLLLSIPALVLFVTYPFAKRFFAIPQAYLGIAYSFGILMAFVEIQNHVPMVGWLLFAANLCWVIGYDTIYAMVDMEDDLKIGIKTSAITFGSKAVPVICGCYTVFALLLACAGYLLNFGMLFWPVWLYAVFLLFYQVYVASHNNRTRLFQMFLLNNRVGYIMFFAIILGLW